MWYDDATCQWLLGSANDYRLSMPRQGVSVMSTRSGWLGGRLAFMSVLEFRLSRSFTVGEVRF